MKMFRIALGLSIGLMGLPARSLLAQVVGPPDAPSVGVVVTPSGLNLRDTPSATGKVLAVLPLGAQVPILATTRVLVVSGMLGRWLQVESRSQKGWVFKAGEPNHYIEEVELLQMPEELFVAQDEGLDLRSGPSMGSQILIHLPHGTPVRRLTTGLFADGKSWVYGASHGYAGYLLHRNTLSSVVYTKEQLEDGPFEGMVITGLQPPYRYQCPNPCPMKILQHDEYSINYLWFKDKVYTYLEYQGKIAQIIFTPTDEFPRGTTIFMGNFVNIDWNCTDPSGNLFPLALADFPFDPAKKIPGKHSNTWSYRDSIRKVWLFDEKAGRLVPAAPPPGSMCHYFEHRG